VCRAAPLPASPGPHIEELLQIPFRLPITFGLHFLENLTIPLLVVMGMGFAGLSMLDLAVVLHANPLIRIMQWCFEFVTSFTEIFAPPITIVLVTIVEAVRLALNDNIYIRTLLLDGFAVDAVLAVLDRDSDDINATADAASAGAGSAAADLGSAFAPSTPATHSNELNLVAETNPATLLGVESVATNLRNLMLSTIVAVLFLTLHAMVKSKQRTEDLEDQRERLRKECRAAGIDPGKVTGETSTISA
jgi:hypothetical protein